MGYVPGYIATITVNGQAYNPDASSATYTLTRSALDKTKLGQDRNTFLSGLGSAALDMTLHLNTTTAVALNTAYETVDPVGFVFRPGALGTHDAGQYSGDCIVTDYSMVGDADGEWDVQLTCQPTGAFTFTAPI